MVPPPQDPPPLRAKRTPSHHRRSEETNVYICAPSTHQTAPTLPLPPPPVPPTVPSEASTPCWGVSGAEDKTPPSKTWMASPGSNCFVSSSSSLASSTNHNHPNTQNPAPRVRATPMVCRWCYSSNPGDCRDGFCSSIWNKENLMRPIHI